MSIEKAQLKMAMAHEIGVRLDDVLEAAETLEKRLSGAPDWVKKAQAAVLSLHADIDKDVNEDRLDLDQAKVLKDLVTKAAGRVQSVLLQIEAEQRIAAGKVAGLRVAVEVTKRAHTEEEAKAAKAAAAEKEAEEAGAERGARKPPLKARRRAKTG